MKKIFSSVPQRSDLTQFVLLSHGSLAEGLIESSKMILGESPNVAAFCFEEGDNFEEYGNEVVSFLENSELENIVFIDLFGGTPCNQLIVKTEGKKVMGITGMSMPMLLEALNLRESFSGEELLEKIENAGHEGVINICKLFE